MRTAFQWRDKVINPIRTAAFLIISTASFSAHAANLCSPGESTLFAFATKANKLLSVCRGPKDGYLAYRFGTPGKIELQFPDRLDASSWKQFTFEGRRRGGGKANSGFFDYALGFSKGGAKYNIYQIEHTENGYSYTIGVDITVGTKSTDIKGVKKSQEGALIDLDDTVDKLPNAADG